MARLIIVAFTMVLFQSLCFAFNPKTASIEEKLVFIDDQKPNVDIIKVNRFVFLLDGLKDRFKESREDIANWTQKAQGALESYGIKESVLEVMESAYRGRPPKKLGKLSYQDAMTMYIMVRNDGMSRAEASQGLKEFYSGLSAMKPARK